MLFCSPNPDLRPFNQSPAACRHPNFRALARWFIHIFPKASLLPPGHLLLCLTSTVVVNESRVVAVLRSGCAGRSNLSGGVKLIENTLRNYEE